MSTVLGQIACSNGCGADVGEGCRLPYPWDPQGEGQTCDRQAAQVAQLDDGHLPVTDKQLVVNALRSLAPHVRAGGHPACADQAQRVAAQLDDGDQHLGDVLPRLVKALMDDAVVSATFDYGRFTVRIFPLPRRGDDPDTSSSCLGRSADLAVALDEALKDYEQR